MNKRQSILCPNCRKLISVSEPMCPFCKTTRPGSFVKNNFWTKLSSDSERLTKAIISVNILFYALSVLIDIRGVNFTPSPFSFLSPGDNALYALGISIPFSLTNHHEWIRVISACWLHGSILHLVFNMMALKQLIPLSVREYGMYRTLTIYMVSGLAGFILSEIFGYLPSLGASGAICGLIGAILYFGKTRGGTYGNLVYKQTSGWIISIFLIGLLPVVDNWAHGGGFLAGVAIAFLLGYNDQKRETLFHKLAAGFLTILTGAVLGRFLIHALFF